jgi:hypothetical protein
MGGAGGDRYAVAFLASGEARFITAEHLSIDAGAQYF